jgi:hypothetical protein
MTTGAVKVLAVLGIEDRTETEIALSTGLTLGQVRSALDELLLTESVRERFFEGLRVYHVRGNQ